jgi:hypothetical protein
MDDLILKSYLEDFVKRFGYQESKGSTQFEYMATHCIIGREYQGHFDAQDLSAGHANGIDSVAIFVNDILVESAAEVSSLAKQNLQARFVFTQTKTSSSYDQGDVLKFGQAVRHFFSNEQKPADYLLASAHEIKEAIYRNAIKFAENPSLDLFYVTSAPHQPNDLIRRTAEDLRKQLEASRLFLSVGFTFIDAEDLKSIYRGLSNKITKHITFEKHTILPKIHGVKRSFIGILPCTEYLKLIRDEHGKLLKNVFYDNVRDYQGENSVNRDILSTLTAEAFGPEIFVLLNNGVTIVSKSINPVGNEFTVRDFQVVNGCQTSHILHRNSDVLNGSEFITIKLIETEDVELANKITKATNRQTEVLLEAFAGLQPFHKELEAFYASIPLESRLYYERRPGQYDFDSSIPYAKVITIPNQIKAFVSIFLEEPQKVHFYYGQLLEDYSAGKESRLFNETHDPYPYFMASRLAFLVNDKLKKRALTAYKKWRYHLAVMVRFLAAGPFDRSRLSDPAYCKKYCEQLANRISDSFDTVFDQALAILKQAISSHATQKSDRDLPQDSNLTKQVLEQCRAQYFGQQPNQSNIDQQRLAENFNGLFLGTVGQLVPEKNFGFINYGQRRFFFRLTKQHLKEDMKVRFKVRTNSRDPEAYDVFPV